MVEDDIIGANRVGMQSILVKTGKFREESLKCSKIKPDYIISSIAELSKLLQLN